MACLFAAFSGSHTADIFCFETNVFAIKLFLLGDFRKRLSLKDGSY